LNLPIYVHACISKTKLSAEVSEAGGNEDWNEEKKTIRVRRVEVNWVAREKIGPYA
jgi:hypothetical protein